LSSGYGSSPSPSSSLSPSAPCGALCERGYFAARSAEVTAHCPQGEGDDVEDVAEMFSRVTSYKAKGRRFYYKNFCRCLINRIRCNLSIIWNYTNREGTCSKP
jgi:hypothetical protein